MKKNNRLLIVVFAVLALIIGVLKGVDYYRYTKVSKERVSSIQAEFVGETAPSQELSMSMFDVTVYTETGSVYSARSFDIDEKKAPAHGDSFDTKIEYHGSTTTVTVPITRSKVVQYKVGYPTKENVLATIYNNGDLEFTGSGNTMNFANGDTPWADEDYTYVIFKDEITPTNVDYWFEGNTALTGCETLPKSIESARGTFQGCENLKKTPSFFQCSSLKIITDCFSGCTSLEQSDPLPVSVMEADGAFEDCIKLTKAPDMTKTNALSSINAIFKGCMSLVDAPVIPDSVLDMSEAFFGRSYVYSVMWETYPTIMRNPLHRDDVIDEIWCVIFEQIDNYDCSKSSLTTFVLPWIRHVVTEYCSRNFHKTTSYYADGIRKVSAAMNYCQEKNIPSSIETLQKLTGLRIPTIKKCIDLLSKKDVVSYEVLSENGFEQSSSLSSPENIFFKNEETESFNHILEESLTEEELEIMILLLQPDNPAKLKASYREIAQKTHTNVPYVKDCISRATMKLKNNKELLREYPNVIKMYDESMVGESAPVLDDGDLIKEQYEELSED